jgi:hypothetical protein
LKEKIMSQEVRSTEVGQKTQTLLKGSLKHVQAAALAALLVPLAAVAIRPAIASAQGSGGTGGGATVPSPCDFTTSGGFVKTDAGAEANFGAHGGCKHDGFWGHLNYVDHATGLHVDSVEITGYLTPDPSSNVRDICGMATTNVPGPQPVYFRVRLIDNGEPGTSDQFGIRLSTNNYLVSTRLLNGGMGGGGNVELHDPNPSTAGPSPSPDEGTMCNGVEAP